LKNAGRRRFRSALLEIVSGTLIIADLTLGVGKVVDEYLG
jgi:acetoacetate decarboxylase